MFAAFTALFNPRGFADVPMALESLSNKRETDVVPTDGSNIETIEDNWHDATRVCFNLGKRWVGRIFFHPAHACADLFAKGDHEHDVVAHLLLEHTS